MYHGPDSVAHFDSFLIDGVISELRTHCPDVFQLFNALGRIERRDDPRSAQVALLRSLLTIIKYRSVKVLGIQLLITFMLIACATSKQVNLK